MKQQKEEKEEEDKRGAELGLLCWSPSLFFSFGPCAKAIIIRVYGTEVELKGGRRKKEARVICPPPGQGRAGQGRHYRIVYSSPLLSPRY